MLFISCYGPTVVGPVASWFGMVCCPSLGGTLIELSFEGQFVDLVCCIMVKDSLDPQSGHLLGGYIDTFIWLSDQNGGFFTLT